jgi:phosphoribosylaminoimidazolecarboxamide formyltransferase/IMP cyclohydrolase
MIKVRRILVSCSDKDGLSEFIKPFYEDGAEIVSTGGTKKYLENNGIKVKDVSSITEFPEILDGRVKTLHPKIFGGILALRDKNSHIETINTHQIPLFDLLVVNLYPFENTINKEHSLEEAIENIDIGGPSLLRAGAKNYKNVAVVVDKEDYDKVLEEYKTNRGISEELSLYLASKVFSYTSYYDGIISEYFRNLKSEKELPKFFTVGYKLAKKLRYGENPHQIASYYVRSEKENIEEGKLSGKELSYNNLLDTESAISLISEFRDKPACVIIKHTNPSGVAIGEDLVSAYKKALSSDPVSAYGSIIAVNKEVDERFATELLGLFIEVLIAPKFEEKALNILKEKKKNMRIIELDRFKIDFTSDRIRSWFGGILVQEADYIDEDWKNIQVPTRRKPDRKEMEELKFAYRIVKHVKSNAIVLTKDGMTLGVGAGQMSRVDSLKIAIMKAEERGFDLSSAVMASDAFFPFRDSIDLAHKVGIKAVIQPGGSIRDEEVIKACDEHNIAMVFTNRRHFKH